MTDPFIPIEFFCEHDHVEATFVRSLHDRGLILVVIHREQQCIASEHLPRLERLARMHYDLDINLEGIEAISHLLERMEHMQNDVRTLRERLNLYEGSDR
jgi:chaperone modulatory protein CbpM